MCYIKEVKVMNQTISFRLTPKRERLLKLLKKRFNIKKNSEAIDLALNMSFKDDIDYKSRLKKVSGCISLKGKATSVKKIRSLRDGM
jgi:hypothetical protein